MSYSQKNIAAIAVLMLISATIFFSIALTAHANPLRFPAGQQTSTATSSPTYMTAGTATSTLYYDAYANGGGSQAFDKALVLTQFSASSTSSILGIAVEYSQGVPGVDCTASPTACDWYQDNTNAFTNASTSQPFIASNNLLNTYVWQYASSTQGHLTTGQESVNRGLKAFYLTTPTRYLRVIYTLTGTNGAVWGQIVGLKQST